MAISATPTNLYVTQANGQVYVQWDLTAGATNYTTSKSTDGVSYTVLAVTSVPSYLDTDVILGTQYYYKVCSGNDSGDSPYTAPQSVVPTPTGEMSLGEIRTRAQQRADRLNSDFVTLPEWNFFINQAMFELYDLLVTAYEDYFVASPVSFTSDGTSTLYPLPNGTNYNAAPAFYKLLGVDLGISSAANGWVSVKKFNFLNRNDFVFPNTASTIYGVFNLRYRLMGTNIEFIPTPSSGQPMRLWYIPRLQELLKDNDLTTIGISGWLQYVIIRAAKYALNKEEADTSALDAELLFLKKRIEESAVNRDAGQPDTITDVRSPGPFGFNGPFDGFRGGW